ncbi:hypothetical protein HDE71_004730 [Janthinobacterium sp. S3M3]|jgi:phosphohistidine phosphatase|nr:hypothetical protein [Janthinobacterium sp. S3T4]MBB5615672.1 hypothetical protein [Janthinobacterium sp. S3M3]
MRKASAGMDRLSQREPGDALSVYLKAVMAHDLVVK